MSETEMSTGDLAAGISKYVIDIEEVGPVSVFVEGDLDKLRVSSNIFLTLHGVGSSYRAWVKFNQEEDMLEVKQRALFLHVSLPGQRPGAPDLATFPDLNTLGLGLVTVLDYLRISRVLLLGDGAGANIALRFALLHPTRVHGVMLLNPSASKGTLERWAWAKNQILRKAKQPKEELNLRNVEKYGAADRDRGEVLGLLALKVKCDVLVICGIRARVVEAGEAIVREMPSGFCSLIRLDCAEDPLTEDAGRVADALVLFAQGFGLVPTAKRKTSRTLSCDSSNIEEGVIVSMVKKSGGRKVSMQSADIPNIRRLSLMDSSHQI